MIVIDASTFVAAIMEDEASDKAHCLYELIVNNDYIATVPSLFYYESAQVLLKSLRRGRIDKNEYKNHLQLLLDFPLTVDEHIPVFDTAFIAEKYSLSFYDAAYLELAKRCGYPLATLDKQLMVAALQAKVKLELNEL
jgi:predicted nucleic acid-binding protein